MTISKDIYVLKSKYFNYLTNKRGILKDLKRKDLSV